MQTIEDPTKPKRAPGPVIGDPALAGSAPAAPSTPDPFAASGGGTLVNGGWIPNNNPDEIARARGQAPAPAAAPPPIDAGGQATPIPAAAPAAAPAPAAPATDVPTAYKDALLKMLNQGDPTMADPTIKAQSDAFGVQQTRAKEHSRSALAERMAAQGGAGVDSGAFNNELVGLEQRQGEAQGAHDAGLLSGELQARRQQLMQAAALAGNQLNAEEARALQKQIADTDAAIRRESLKQNAGQFDVDAGIRKQGLDLQGSLGQGDLNLRKLLGEGNLNLGLMSALMQNQQFGQGLSANVGMFNAGQNNNYLQALLGALGGAQ